MAEDGKEKKEIYTYTPPWLAYGLSWSVRQDKPYRLALGSFIEEYSNKIQIVQLDEESSSFKVVSTFDHPYPTTKIKFIPDKTGSHSDLLGTTGDYMRIWQIKVSHSNLFLKFCIFGGFGYVLSSNSKWRVSQEDGDKTSAHLKSLLNSNKSSEYCAPLTSFDWNEQDPTLLGTSSIDTTCTIWNVETSQAKTQLIAHDREVYDLAFAANCTELFASVGADGSMRLFDLRSLEQSTIIYESADLTPLLRLCWNKLDRNYLATFAMDSSKTVILDVRVPGLPVAELRGHQACINAAAWAPHSSCHICTASDDNQAAIWELSRIPAPVEDPILAYTADAQINNLVWSDTWPDWIAISIAEKMQILRV